MTWHDTPERYWHNPIYRSNRNKIKQGILRYYKTTIYLTFVFGCLTLDIWHLTSYSYMILAQILISQDLIKEHEWDIWKRFKMVILAIRVRSVSCNMDLRDASATKKRGGFEIECIAACFLNWTNQRCIPDDDDGDVEAMPSGIMGGLLPVTTDRRELAVWIFGALLP